jgi:hypothetical protein
LTLQKSRLGSWSLPWQNGSEFREDASMHGR